MSFYGNAVATALKLLTSKGQAMTLTQEAPATYNPATGTNTPGTVTNTTVKGIVTDYKDRTTAGSNSDGETLVQRGDRKALFSASGVAAAPTANDTLTIGGVVWRIVFCKALDLGGTPVVYECQVRK